MTRVIAHGWQILPWNVARRWARWSDGVESYEDFGAGVCETDHCIGMGQGRAPVGVLEPVEYREEARR